MSKLGVLRDVLPCFAIDYVVNAYSRHAERLGEAKARFAFCGTLSDFLYLGLIELCLMVLRTLHSRWVNSAVLVAHIARIVLLCTKKQVCRITTRWVVACVADMLAGWNWAVMQFVAKAMGIDANALDGKNSVTGLAQLLFPYPTAIWRILVYGLPKAFYGGAVGRSVMGFDVGDGFSPEPSKITSGHFGNVGLLAATAMAITVGYFLSVHMSILARIF